MMVEVVLQIPGHFAIRYCSTPFWVMFPCLSKRVSRVLVLYGYIQVPVLMLIGCPIRSDEDLEEAGFSPGEGLVLALKHCLRRS